MQCHRHRGEPGQRSESVGSGQVDDVLRTGQRQRVGDVVDQVVRYGDQDDVGTSGDLIGGQHGHMRKKTGGAFA